MKEKEWLYGMIREIKDMPYGIKAAIALDTDDVPVLCFSLNNGEYSFHFGISWLEEKNKEDVDWLARVVGRNIYESYMTGWNDKGKDISNSLKGLKNLLAEIR